MAASNAREAGDQLELEVEPVAAAGVCPTCGRGSVDVKERQPTCLCWRKSALPLPPA